MVKLNFIRNLFFVLLPLLALALVAQAQDHPAPDDLTVIGLGQRYTENIPVIDMSDLGIQPAQIPMTENSAFTPSASSGQAFHHSAFQAGGGSDPTNPYAVIRKTGPATIQPGGTTRYEITLTNYESLTHTYRLTDTLPPQLTYVPDSATATELVPSLSRYSVQASGLVYDPAARTLSWQGVLAPGRLDYVIEENSITLPYLDLADFGAVNLCDDFIADGEACEAVSVTFNLGVNGYTTNLYGEVLSQLTVSANGLILGHDAVASGHNPWLPAAATPGLVLAGLWRDVDMGGIDTAPNGRFHAAIISGLVQGHDVFYAQWHNVPHANDSTPLRASPELAEETSPTARHAIAILLNKDTAAGSAQVMAGHAFFIYDNISDPAHMVAQGYTIGIADKSGVRGVTYAYAPCCADPQPPQGYPPTSGTTLHLRPVLFGAASDYQRTFSYQAMVNAQVPETIISTAVASSSSDNPALAHVWSSHYLYVRLQTYLPFLRHDEVVGP